MKLFSTILLLALAALTVGCETDQRAIMVVREHGDRYYDRGEYTAAAAEYREVVDRAPSDWKYRMKLGETLLLLDEPRLAREQLAVAYGMRPNNDEILELFAESLLATDDTETLFRVLTDRTVQNQRVTDYLRLGRFASRAGDDDTAERAFVTAAKIDGGQTVEPQLALADFYTEVGDHTRALRRLRMALYLAPNDESIKEMIRSYGEIPGPSYAIVPEEAG